MAECGLYFGTEEHMTWLPAPNGEAGASPVAWGTSSVFLNGGATARRSQVHHRTYNFGWTLKPYHELAKILDFYNGRYGEGPFHMVMPGTHENIMPLYWSMPRVTIEDGPHMLPGLKPEKVSVETTTLGRPTIGARYTISDPELYEPRTITLPVPPGYHLHFGVHGEFTETARIQVGTQDIIPLAMNSTALTNTVISTPGLYEVSLQGSGEASIFSMTARLSERDDDAAEHTEFRPGRGTSAVDFIADSVEVTVSSAVRDFYHGTATLVEVGVWA